MEAGEKSQCRGDIVAKLSSNRLRLRAGCFQTTVEESDQGNAWLAVNHRTALRNTKVIHVRLEKTKDDVLGAMSVRGSEF